MTFRIVGKPWLCERKWCDELFIIKNPNHKYHSPKCQIIANTKRQRERRMKKQVKSHEK